MWKVHKWLPVAMAMGPILGKLLMDPSKGLLGFRVQGGLRSITVIQSWLSLKQLELFARTPDDPHRPAWLRFNRHVVSD